MKKFKLGLLQLKTALNAYLKGLLLLVALFVLVGIGLVGIWKHINQIDVGEHAILNTAIVADEGSLGTEYLISMVEGVQGVASICNLQKMEWPDALDGLQEGDVDVIIRIPDEFYVKAMNMEETQIEIYTWGEPTKLQKMLLAQLSGAQNLMSTTECAIYACYDGIEACEVPYTRAQIEYDLFMDTVTGFMNRDRLFSISNLSAYGSYDFGQYYYISAIILVMTVSAVSLFSMYRHGERQLERLIYSGSSGYICASISRIITMTIAIAVTTSVLCLVVNMVVGKVDLFSVSALPRLYWYIWLVALSISVWIHLIASVCGDSAHSRAIYVSLVILLLAGAGVVVPIVYLPGILRGLSTYLPMGAWHTLLMDAAFGQRRINGVNTTIITDVFIGILAVLVYLRSLLNHD